MDDDLAGLLADSDSSGGNSDSSVSNSDLVLELDDLLGGSDRDDLVSPSSDGLGVASARLLLSSDGDSDDLAGLGASGDSASVDSDLVVESDLLSGDGDSDESSSQGGTSA